MKKNLSQNHPYTRDHKWLRRIGWLVFIWAASVVLLGMIALLLRALMTTAGMSS